MHLKNLKKYFKKLQKLQKYQYGLDDLFKEHNEEDYLMVSLTSNNDISAIEELRKLFTDRRSNLFM